jgi:hypothetical protein
MSFAEAGRRRAASRPVARKEESPRAADPGAGRLKGDHRLVSPDWRISRLRLPIGGETIEANRWLFSAGALWDGTGTGGNERLDVVVAVHSCTAGR